jgi:hypothetical protein
MIPGARCVFSGVQWVRLFTAGFPDPAGDCQSEKRPVFLSGLPPCLPS